MSSPLPSPSQTPPPGQDRGVRFSDNQQQNQTPLLRSQHFVSRAEIIKGLSNRFVFSTFYIYLYLGMAVLSLATVVLSLMSDCPTLTFYILEIIVNTTMIAEVSIRLVAFGKQFWKSYYNTLDLAITVFCVITLVVIFFSGCSAKGEEVFDIFLLVIRNFFQFGRLALVMRKSGKNVFTRPAPIDLSSARAYSFSLDLDLDDEEALSTERRAMGGDVEAIGQHNKTRRGPEDGRPFLDSDGEDWDDDEPPARRF
ncbi:hypothetical protein T439DRAFT_136712 [Meredithblackwellia eburnea MCA 4105]